MLGAIEGTTGAWVSHLGRAEELRGQHRRHLARPTETDPRLLPQPLTRPDAPRRRALDQPLAAPTLRAELLECRLALRRLSLADLRDDDDDKLVDACIGIEALLSNDSIEIAHKIATRGAAALAAPSAKPIEAQKAFRMFKAVYGRRSDLVHGKGGDKKAVFELNGTKIRTSTLASILLRELLLSLLTSDLPWSIQDLDDELMLSLNRGNNRQAASDPETAPADGEHTSAPQPGA